MHKVTVFVVVLIHAISVLFAQPPRSAYVVNSVGENLSVINLETGQVTSNAATLGLFANHIKLRHERAYVVNSGLNEIQVIDLNTLNTVNRIDVGSGSNPWAIEFVSDQLAAVSRLFTNEVAFIDVSSGQVMQTVTVGSGPEGMVYSNGTLYVANTGFNGVGWDPGVVSAIDVSNYTVSNISVGVNPQALAVDSQGNIIVACTGDYAAAPGQMDIIDATSQTVVHSEVVNTPITNVLVTGQDKAYLATFGSGILVYDLSGRIFERDASNALPGGPGMVTDGLGNMLACDFGADSVYLYSSNHQLLAGYLVGDGPVALDVYRAGPNGLGDIEEATGRTFVLSQNYPNPFNPSTRVEVQMNRAAMAAADIYNVLGQKIATIWNGVLNAGVKTLQWNGRNDAGVPMPSGHYFLKFESGTEVAWIKMQLIR